MLFRIGYFCLTLLAAVQCLERCIDGRLCPIGNTCCKGGCISNNLGLGNATCCQDGITGCGVGYRCGEEVKNGVDSQTCVATAQVKDPLLQRLPRYTLCRPAQSSLETLHGFPVEDPVSKLAYYSSHGDVVADADLRTVDHIFISIHGATRNADDYFCAASAAVQLQSVYSNVLVVVPFFAAGSDGPLLLREGGTALRWKGDADGPWRYGARSLHPIRVSSFDAMDLLVETILLRTTNAAMTIFGHSSGGQFVQRWSLLTSVDSSRWRAIVANPSSYAYLTPLRKIQGQWQTVPGNSNCTRYNEWAWGLEDSETIDDGYKRRAMRNMTAEGVVDRFRFRSVTYMIGSLDRCNVSGTTTSGWCMSDGLETTCMDDLQGSMRWERHFHYYESLGLVGIDLRHHRRVLVEGVGHDHTLMMQTPDAMSAIFPAKPESLDKGFAFK